MYINKHIIDWRSGNLMINATILAVQKITENVYVMVMFLFPENLSTPRISPKSRLLLSHFRITFK